MKRKILFLSMLLIVCTGFANILLAQDWYKYTSDDKSFSIDFPVKPEVNTRHVRYNDANTTVIIITNKVQDTTKDKNFIYSVSVSEYPDSTVNTTDCERNDSLICKNINMMVHARNGKLTYSNKCMRDSACGREYGFYAEAMKISINSLCFLKSNKMYTISVISYLWNKDNNDIRKYLNSFKFLK